MRYLNKTKEYMLRYRRVGNLKVLGYIDSDLGGCPDDRKSTSRFIFIMDGGVIS